MLSGPCHAGHLRFGHAPILWEARDDRKDRKYLADRVVGTFWDKLQ
jgi:hypothetical protein